VTRRPTRRVASRLVLALGLLAALVFAEAGLSEPASIATKRAQAADVLAQIQQIDSQLDKVIDAYNRANERLSSIERQTKVTERRLAIARKASQAAERNLESRLVTLYTQGEQNLIEVILGSTSLDDLLNRVDAAKRVSSLDERILKDVRDSRAAYTHELAKLRTMQAEQRRVVAERAATKQQIESHLAERQKLLDSIKGEIARLQEQERRQQARLKAEAERRLATDPASTSEAISSAGGPTTTAVPASRYGGVVGIAMGYLGVPYQWGGASPSTGFDCSGFVMYVFAKVGMSLPHSSYAQYGYGVPVSRDQLQPGDLVFFDGLGHVGIYIGGGEFIHAPHTGDVVKISSISGWYADTYVGARRIL
jgi:cell wall-associated NlpC family hydrolase